MNAITPNNTSSPCDSSAAFAAPLALPPDVWSRIEGLSNAHLQHSFEPHRAYARAKDNLYQRMLTRSHHLVNGLELASLHQALMREYPDALTTRDHGDPSTWTVVNEACSYRAFMLGRLDGGKRKLCRIRAGLWDENLRDWERGDANFPKLHPLVYLEAAFRDPLTSDVRTMDVMVYAQHVTVTGCPLRFNDPRLTETLQHAMEMLNLYAQMHELPGPAPVSEPLLRPINELKALWADVVLPEAVKEPLIIQQALFSLGDPACGRGLLLKGAPGTGKTHLARVFAAASGAEFFQLTEADLKSPTIGGSAQAVKTLWEKASTTASGRAVLFLDECEGLFGRRGGLESDSGCAEALRTLLPLWDGMAASNTAGAAPSIFVIGATNRPELLDAAALSRFGGSVELSLPEAAARRVLLARSLSRYGVGVGADGLDVESTAMDRATAGLSGRDLDDIAMRLRRNCIGRAATVVDLLQLLQARRSDGNTHVDPRATWNRLVVPSKVKEALLDLSFLVQQSERLAVHGFKCPSALLLYGPPGTGKTQCARTLANEVGAHFIAASTAELKAGFIGQSGQRVKQLFEDARSHAPCIVFLDEIDAVASLRGTNASDSFSVEVLNQLLQELDGIRDPRGAPVVIIAATNRIDAIDPALLSRFVETLEVPLPDPTERLQLLRIVLESVALSEAARTAVERWVAKTDGDANATNDANRDNSSLSHRDIDQLVQRIRGQAVRRMRLAAVASETTEAEDQGSGDAFRIEVGDVSAILPLAVQSTDRPPILATALASTAVAAAANHDRHDHPDLHDGSEASAGDDMNVSAATIVDHTQLNQLNQLAQVA